MTKQTTSKFRQTARMTAAIFMMLVLGAIYPTAIAQVKTPAAKRQAASAPAGGPKEGIRVHGQWTIDVRNPNGKLVTHREFKNALTQSGATFLTNFIARNFVPGEWRIMLTGTYGTWTISETSSIEPSAFPTLTATYESSGLVLRGTVTAPATGRIDEVHTGLTVCGYSEALVCRTPGHQSDNQVRFTSKTLSPSTVPPTAPVDVTQGQIIQVTVTISFS